MRHLPYILILVLIAALDWAALHDIVKGEPDLTLEYATLVFSVVAVGVLVLLLLRRRARMT